jgi:putative ABC transport system permease protein
MSAMLDEFRYALRGLSRAPGFTAVAVFTLALGIGATTAVFTLVDSVLLRALPHPQSERLLSIQHVGRGADQIPISPGLYVLYSEHARTLGSIAMHSPAVMNFTGEGEPERVEGQLVTPSIFEVLRVPPALGRPILASDAEQGAEPVVVLTHALWQSSFGGDPSLIDQTVMIDGVARRVVGILPPGFAYPTQDTRFWAPLPVNPIDPSLASFSATGIARLSEGATAEAAQAELQSIIARLDQLVPDAGPVLGFIREVNLTANVRMLKDQLVGDVGRTLWTLLGMVAFVLLIACANVANLLLVRAEGRQRELALRLAVGAGRWQLLRPFLAESLVLGVAGGALGVGIAMLAVRATTALAPANLPRMDEVGLDLRVLAFAAALSLLSAVVFGLFPVLRYRRQDLSGALKEGGVRGGTAGHERLRVRNTLVVAQVTLALVLLIGSGLMFRSFMALMAVDPGFDREGVLTVRLTVPAGEVPEPLVVADLYRQLRERLAEQPNVLSVGSAGLVPLSGQNALAGHFIEDRPTAPGEIPPMAFLNYADPGYLETLRIPVVEGRGPEPQDGSTGFRGVLVSRAYAERWWPGESALGRRLSQSPESDRWEIVGVVENVRHRGLQEDPEEMIYFPTTTGTSAQPQALRTRDIVVRVNGDPLAFLPVLRREVRELNARIPLSNPQTLETIVQASTAQTSFTMAVLGSASAVALLLALVGIYGVISYVVGQRTREIGVRLALGATGESVRRLVVRQGMLLAGVGVALGLIVALLASQVIDSLLFGVDSRDPLTYAAVALSLGLVAALASWVPATRAAGVDPAMALRRE